MTIDQLYQLFLQYPIVCTDTRNILPGSIFFALKGENFDGNSFAMQALESGAVYVVLDDAKYAGDERCILVENVLETLQALAHHHRKKFNIPLIGITGTNGKTTTKELIHAALSAKYKTYATQGNLNNHLGVPFTLLALTKDVEMAIVEMGANHQKEIQALCEIANPDYGLITNVGYAHLEGFGGFEGVKKGKKELYDHIHLKNGTIFINGDDTDLMEMAAALERKISYGSGIYMDVRGRVLSGEPTLCVAFQVMGSETIYQVHTQLIGEYNLNNVLAAICVANYFEVPIPDIIKSIEAYRPENNRSQLSRSDYNTIIKDAYNANPSSMHAAIDNFSKTPASKKLLVLGDMFELGPESLRCHKEIIAFIKEKGFAEALFCGKEFYANKTDDYLFFQSSEELLQYLKEAQYRDYTILLKGSRGMKLERMLEAI